jgi:hypothetical protein
MGLRNGVGVRFEGWKIEERGGGRGEIWKI